MDPFVLSILSLGSSAHTLTGRDRLLTSMNAQPGQSFHIQQGKVATHAKYATINNLEVTQRVVATFCIL